jgi:hypothetical protein
MDLVLLPRGKLPVGGARRKCRASASRCALCGGFHHASSADASASAIPSKSFGKS